VPRHLDGRLGQASADAQAGIGVVGLGGEVLDPPGTGQLVDVGGDPPQDGDDPLVGGQLAVVQRVVGAQPQLQDLGHAGAHQLVQPAGHVPERLGLIGQAFGNGVPRGGIVGVDPLVWASRGCVARPGGPPR